MNDGSLFASIGQIAVEAAMRTLEANNYTVCNNIFYRCLLMVLNYLP